MMACKANCHKLSKYAAKKGELEIEKEIVRLFMFTREKLSRENIAENMLCFGIRNYSDIITQPVFNVFKSLLNIKLDS